MDRAQSYLQQLEVNAGLIVNIKADQLGDPTPCDDFDVRALVNHYLCGVEALAKSARGEAASFPWDGTDFSGPSGEGFGPAATRLLEDAEAAWRAPDVTERTFTLGQGMPGDMALHIALGEVVLHGWDIAKATHQPYSIPDEIAKPMVERFQKEFAARGIGEDRPAGSPFGPEVQVPDDATAGDKLVAFSGRTP